MKNIVKKGSKFSDYLMENLKDDQFAFDYLKEILEETRIVDDNGLDPLIKSLDKIIRARGMQNIANKAETTRQTLNELRPTKKRSLYKKLHIIKSEKREIKISQDLRLDEEKLTLDKKDEKAVIGIINAVADKYVSRQKKSYATGEEVFGKDITDSKIRIGKIISAARLKEGISQIELAKKLNLKQSNLSAVENGKRSFPKSILIQIAKILNINCSRN